MGILKKQTSLLGEKAAQKFNNGCTVLKVWLFDTSSAKRLASSMNLSRSSATSASRKLKKGWKKWEDEQTHNRRKRISNWRGLLMTQTQWEGEPLKEEDWVFWGAQFAISSYVPQVIE